MPRRRSVADRDRDARAVDLRAPSRPRTTSRSPSKGCCEISPRSACDVICRRWQEQAGDKPQRVLSDGSLEPADFTRSDR